MEKNTQLTPAMYQGIQVLSKSSMLTIAWHNCDEIHIAFDHYREDSIKNSNRRRRAKSKEKTVLDMVSLNQNVTVIIKYFWLSTINKTLLQAFYVEWLTTDYQYSKPVYLGTWLVSARCASPFPSLNCTHKEVHDKMMFHVQDTLSRQSGPTSIT